LTICSHCRFSFLMSLRQTFAQISARISLMSPDSRMVDWVSLDLGVSGQS